MTSPHHSPGDCVFCAIALGTQAARIVYQDEHAVGFFPLEPAAVGHTLVIPRVHVANFLELDASAGPPLLQSAIRIGNALVSVLKPDGMNLITSAGEAASQTVFHLHLHLVPRWTGDAMGDIWPPGERWVDQVEDRIVDEVREAASGAAGRSGS